MKFYTLRKDGKFLVAYTCSVDTIYGFDTDDYGFNDVPDLSASSYSIDWVKTMQQKYGGDIVAFAITEVEE